MSDTKVQNYLFVDIDGPLLPGKSHLFPQNREFLHHFNNGMKGQELFDKYPPMFDEWAVRAHNLLAKYGDAKVVIVTNWRNWCEIEELQEMFKMQGLEWKYADRPSCIKRGMSSERYHDVAEHMENYLPDNSRALIIDDFDMMALNHFYKLEDQEEWEEKDAYGYIAHDDRQTLIVNEEKDIRARWLDIDFSNGMTVEQFKLGAAFFGVDWEQLNFEEFGVPIKTQEEKDREREQMEKYYHALIV